MHCHARVGVAAGAVEIQVDLLALGERRQKVRDLLRRGYNREDTEKQLDIAIDWGRYGELFDYDADSGELILSEVAAGLAVTLDDGRRGD